MSTPTDLCIDRDKVVHDVASLAYVAADVREGNYTAHSLHQTFDVCEAGNIDRVNRILDLAEAEARNMIGFPLSDRHRQPSPETLRYLRQLTHEYLVTRVFTDWLEIAFPPLLSTTSSVRAGSDNIIAIWREKCEAAGKALQSAATFLSCRSFTRRLPPI